MKQPPLEKEPAKKESAKNTSATKESATNESKTLIAHLPKITNLPAEIIKPDALGHNYPSTGFEPLNPLGPSGLERLNSARKELSHWTEPASLLSLLDEIGKAKQSSGWASETGRLVHDLGPAVASGSDQAGEILDRLADSRLEAMRLADSIDAGPLSRKLRQAAYAIERRLEVWREIQRLGASAMVETDKPKFDSGHMSMCLAEIDNLTKTSADGRQWRKYLLVDALVDLSFERSASESQAQEQRKITQQVLARLTETPLSARQRQFIAKEPMAGFCEELRHWAADPLTSADVLRDIEQYEQTRLPSDARRLGGDLRSLAQSSDPQRLELARGVETHYRNANVRVSLTEDLLNRLIPAQKTEIAPVSDTLMGVPVRGQSMTSTDVALRLIPDPNRVRHGTGSDRRGGGHDLLDQRSGNVLQRQRFAILRAKTV